MIYIRLFWVPILDSGRNCGYLIFILVHAADIQDRDGAVGVLKAKGNCYDNASVETFFKTIKAELIWRQSWPTRRQAEAAIFQYINGFYNTRRRHSYLGGISPLAFEAKVA